jgi:RimJ/RimL family protein N-acetyltransferase
MNLNNDLQLRYLYRDSSNAKLLQEVYEKTPGYFIKVRGTPAEPQAAERTFSMIPDGMSYEDKFTFGMFLKSELIGIVDLIRGYPDDRTAFIGLFLIAEPYQKLKLGFQSFHELESEVRKWPEVQKLRLSVLETNSQVIPFWKKCGFSPTGERKPHEEGIVKSEHILFEKMLR